MKSYSAAEARSHLAEVLDEAEAGVTVTIERRGVQFKLVRDRKAKKPTPFQIDILDPALLEQGWRFELGRGGGWGLKEGVRLAPKKRARRT